MKSSRRPPLRIAFAVPAGLPFIERIQQGIATYAQDHGGWNFTRLPEMIGSSPEWLRGWRGDGAFIYGTSEADFRCAKSLRFPVVNLSSYSAAHSIPTVSLDHRAVGILAANHLLARRFVRMGFFGAEDMHYSSRRLQGFEETIRDRATLDPLIVPLPSGSNFRWRDQEREIDRWLRRQVLPVGIFAATDHRASMLVEACQRLGLRVPRDVAILGVDNDALICEHHRPTISSIARNDIEAGRLAARLLHRLIDGGNGPDWLTVPPEKVVERESSATLAVDDPLIADAISRIHQQIATPFGANEIASSTSISRRQFENRFKAALGCTPYAFINRVRIDRARELLTKDPARPLAEIAAQCGFTSARRFSLVFSNSTGTLPSRWRENIP